MVNDTTQELDDTSRRARRKARHRQIGRMMKHHDEFRGRMAGGHRGRRGGPRANRGDTRAAILALLTEEPMHGYQIISELDERTEGAWKPSPGSIYPALQLLADEGLVTGEETDGRNTFSLTKAGSKLAADAAEEAPPWERFTADQNATDLRQAVFAVGGAAKQIGMTGTPELKARATEILVETRKRLYQLLAE